MQQRLAGEVLADVHGLRGMQLAEIMVRGRPGKRLRPKPPATTGAVGRQAGDGNDAEARQQGGSDFSLGGSSVRKLAAEYPTTPAPFSRRLPRDACNIGRMKRLFRIAYAAGAVCQRARPGPPCRRASAVPGGVLVVDVGAAAASGTAGDLAGPRRTGHRQMRAATRPLLASRWPPHPATTRWKSPTPPGTKASLPVKVAAKKYREQRLTVPPSQVDLSPEDAARVEDRNEAATRTPSTASAPRCPPPFHAGATGGRRPRSDSYGSRRVFNGQSRNPHSGMDIAAPTGAAIVAPADGVVLDTGGFLLQRQHRVDRPRPWLHHHVLPSRPPSR